MESYTFHLKSHTECACTQPTHNLETIISAKCGRIGSGLAPPPIIHCTPHALALSGVAGALALGAR